MLVVDSKQRRLELIADIEGMGREANEAISRAGLAQSDDRHEPFRCECGDDTCSQMLTIPRAVYERARSDVMQFVVVPEHIIPEAETVVERGDGFWILRKNEEVRPTVEASDPRS